MLGGRRNGRPLVVDESGTTEPGCGKQADLAVERIDSAERAGVDDLGVVELGQGLAPGSDRPRARGPSPASRSPAAMAAAPATSAQWSTGAAARSSGVEVDVAARHGQAVGLADRRAADDLDRERQVGRHAPDHRELLPVLLAEVGRGTVRRC